MVLVFKLPSIYNWLLELPTPKFPLDLKNVLTPVEKSLVHSNASHHREGPVKSCFPYKRRDNLRAAHGRLNGVHLCSSSLGSQAGGSAHHKVLLGPKPMALRNLALYGPQEHPQLGESISHFSAQSHFKKKLFLQEDYFITQRLPSSEEADWSLFQTHCWTKLNPSLIHYRNYYRRVSAGKKKKKKKCRNRYMRQNHHLYINLYLCCRTCNYTILQQLKIWHTNCIWHANWILLSNKFLLEKNIRKKQM